MYFQLQIRNRNFSQTMNMSEISRESEGIFSSLSFSRDQSRETAVANTTFHQQSSANGIHPTY